MTMNTGWQTQDRFLELHLHWLTVIGEHLQDETGQILEYWRVEKADSAIILPIQNQQLILPPPTYRPGLGEKTLDFPGGRVLQGEDIITTVHKILQRELGILPENISQLTPLNNQGWAVNSSFSNQRLFGFVAELQPTAQIPSNFIGSMYPTNDTGIASLLKALICLQCRAVLLEWRFRVNECSLISNPI
ncbi:NUDIX hydrolase [Aetokthonos hydrillicola CCALA 1050]|nr:NUDIX hydrolase [Aetokthonos hydrillicola CCALA 1050]